MILNISLQLWWLESSHSRNIYTMEAGKHYKSGLLFVLFMSKKVMEKMQIPRLEHKRVLHLALLYRLKKKKSTKSEEIFIQHSVQQRSIVSLTKSMEL